MAKSELRLKAVTMRSTGESVRDIARALGVSKSTASMWVRDVILTVEQLEKLQNRMLKGGELGRIKGAFVQKQRRLDLIEKEKTVGIKKLRGLTESEFFAAGIALYWAEGSKKKREFFICNSDPDLIIFMLRWMKTFFGITTDQLKVNVGINEIHKEREEIVKKYWANITRISLERFRKTSFKKSKVYKKYANFNEHFGTFSIHVLKGSHFYYKMLGFISGLAEAGKNFKAG